MRRVRGRDLSEKDLREIEKFREFLGVVSRARAAGGRDLRELHLAYYGPDGSGEERRDFEKKH